MRIETGRIHVWQAKRDPLFSVTDDISDALSIDEIERAQRFHFPEDTIHFIWRRFTLRSILSKYCECKPKELVFGYHTIYKKPYLRSPAWQTVSFNLSFSGDVMLVAISKHDDTGIDIEKITNIPDMFDVAVSCFSGEELRLFKSSTGDPETFYRIWTRKEAFIKALGMGMHYPLQSFCVSMDHCAHPVIFNDPAGSGEWQIAEITVPRGYVAALAVRAGEFAVEYFTV